MIFLDVTEAVVDVAVVDGVVSVPTTEEKAQSKQHCHIFSVY